MSVKYFCDVCGNEVRQEEWMELTTKENGEPMKMRVAVKVELASSMNDASRICWACTVIGVVHAYNKRRAEGMPEAKISWKEKG